MMNVNEAARKFLNIRTADGIMRHTMFLTLAIMRASATERPAPSTQLEVDAAVAEEFVIWWKSVEAGT